MTAGAIGAGDPFHDDVSTIDPLWDTTCGDLADVEAWNRDGVEIDEATVDGVPQGPVADETWLPVDCE